MTTTIAPLETSYRGHRFRSRLEARWAVFFDHLGIKWEYEKEGFRLSNGEAYLPDFWLPQVRMWAEVKGQDFTAKEIWRCHLLTLGTGHKCLMLNGVPDGRNFWACHTGSFYGCFEDPPYFGDYVLHAYRYWESEGRFYNCTGHDYPNQDIDTDWFEDARAAIKAALSARF